LALIVDPATDGFECLYQFVRGLQGLRTHDEIALALVESARLEPGSTAALVEPQPAGGALAVVAASGPDAAALNGHEFRSDVSLVGLAFRTAVVLVSPNLERDLRAGILHRSGLSARSAVCLPVCVGEVSMGVLMVLFPHAADVDPSVMSLLRGLAAAAAPAIERSRLQREADRLARHVCALQEVSQVLTTAGPELAQTLLVDLLTGILGLDSCCVATPNGEGAFRVTAAAGRNATALRQMLIPADRIESGDVLGNAAIAEAAVLPVRSRSGPAGYLIVARSGEAIGSQEESLLAVWVAILGVALEQAAHAGEVPQLAHDMQGNQVVPARALRVERRRYADRAAALALEAGRILGLPDGQVGDLEAAARLSGLIWTHSSPNEDGALEAQSEVAGLFTGSPVLDRVAPMLRYMGEHWDGSGGPDRLRGDQIPIGARILSAVGACASVGAAPGSGSQSAEAATRLLRSGAGTRFDPKVVSTLVAVLSLGGTVLERPVRRDPPVMPSEQANQPPSPPRPVGATAAQVSHLLTDREAEILHMVARGMKNGEIALELRLSPATVKTHVSRMLRKLRIADRTKAAVYVLQGGFVNATSAT